MSRKTTHDEMIVEYDQRMAEGFAALSSILEEQEAQFEERVAADAADLKERIFTHSLSEDQLAFLGVGEIDHAEHELSDGIAAYREDVEEQHSEMQRAIDRAFENYRTDATKLEEKLVDVAHMLAEDEHTAGGPNVRSAVIAPRLDQASHFFKERSNAAEIRYHERCEVAETAQEELERLFADRKQAWMRARHEQLVGSFKGQCLCIEQLWPPPLTFCYSAMGSKHRDIIEKRNEVIRGLCSTIEASHFPLKEDIKEALDRVDEIADSLEEEMISKESAVGDAESGLEGAEVARMMSDRADLEGRIAEVGHQTGDELQATISSAIEPPYDMWATHLRTVREHVFTTARYDLGMARAAADLIRDMLMRVADQAELLLEELDDLEATFSAKIVGAGQEHKAREKELRGQLDALEADFRFLTDEECVDGLEKRGQELLDELESVHHAFYEKVTSLGAAFVPDIEAAFSRAGCAVVRATGSAVVDSMPFVMKKLDDDTEAEEEGKEEVPAPEEDSTDPPDDPEAARLAALPDAAIRAGEDAVDRIVEGGVTIMVYRATEDLFRSVTTPPAPVRWGFDPHSIEVDGGGAGDGLDIDEAVDEERENNEAAAQAVMDAKAGGYANRLADFDEERPPEDVEGELIIVEPMTSQPLHARLQIDMVELGPFMDTLIASLARAIGAEFSERRAHAEGMVHGVNSTLDTELVHRLRALEPERVRLAHALPSASRGLLAKRRGEVTRGLGQTARLVTNLTAEFRMDRRDARGLDDDITALHDIVAFRVLDREPRRTAAPDIPTILTTFTTQCKKSDKACRRATRADEVNCAIRTMRRHVSLNLTRGLDAVMEQLFMRLEARAAVIAKLHSQLLDTLAEFATPADPLGLGHGVARVEAQLAMVVEDVHATVHDWRRTILRACTAHVDTIEARHAATRESLAARDALVRHQQRETRAIESTVTSTVALVDAMGVETAAYSARAAALTPVGDGPYHWPRDMQRSEVALARVGVALGIWDVDAVEINTDRHDAVTHLLQETVGVTPGESTHPADMDTFVPVNLQNDCKTRLDGFMAKMAGRTKGVDNTGAIITELTAWADATRESVDGEVDKARARLEEAVARLPGAAAAGGAAVLEAVGARYRELWAAHVGKVTGALGGIVKARRAEHTAAKAALRPTLRVRSGQALLHDIDAKEVAAQKMFRAAVRRHWTETVDAFQTSARTAGMGVWTMLGELGAMVAGTPTLPGVEVAPTPAAPIPEDVVAPLDSVVQPPEFIDCPTPVEPEPEKSEKKKGSRPGTKADKKRKPKEAEPEPAAPTTPHIDWSDAPAVIAPSTLTDSATVTMTSIVEAMCSGMSGVVDQLGSMWSWEAGWGSEWPELVKELDLPDEVIAG